MTKKRMQEFLALTHPELLPNYCLRHHPKALGKKTSMDNLLQVHVKTLQRVSAHELP